MPISLIVRITLACILPLLTITPLVGNELAPVMEFERVAVDVGDGPSGLGDDQCPGCVIPDFFTIICAGG